MRDSGRRTCSDILRCQDETSKIKLQARDVYTGALPSPVSNQQVEVGNVLFNGTLITFFLTVIYGVGHMVKDHSDCERKEMFYLTAHLTHFIYG